MAKIEIAGERYLVVESLGFQQSAGGYAKLVETPNGEKMAFKYPRGLWFFWTAQNRVQPLREAALRGWPRKDERDRGTGLS